MVIFQYSFYLFSAESPIFSSPGYDNKCHPAAMSLIRRLEVLKGPISIIQVFSNLHTIYMVSYNFDAYLYFQCTSNYINLLKLLSKQALSVYLTLSVIRGQVPALF